MMDLVDIILLVESVILYAFAWHLLYKIKYECIPDSLTRLYKSGECSASTWIERSIKESNGE